ncbi:receptor-type tyrosine-protein phosphatase beta-like [Branchiostoma floridae x Branchiostoma belcheri]
MFVVEWWKKGNEGQRQNYTRTSPDAQLEHLQPGTTYVVELSAKKNDVQSGSLLQEIVTKPMHPEKLTLESDVNEIKVSWKKPKHGGVDDYEVTLVNNSSGTVVKTFTENGTATTISRLSPGTGYKVRIAAKYHSISSDHREECIVTSGWFRSDPQICVHISAPDGPDETEKLLGGQSTKRFSDLRPATLYTIRVAVVGFMGEGKPTTVTCPTRPRPITSISVSEQTTAAIKVQWSAAKDNDVTYMAQITGKDPILLGKDLACCFDELDPGTSYDISITVKHTFQDGTEVISRPCKTKASTCPAPPEAVSIKSCSPSSITLAWKPPISGNIDCYKVKIWCTDQTSTRSTEQKPGQSHSIGKHCSTKCTFDSLSPGSPHKITISSQFQNLSSEIVEIKQRTKLRSPDLKLREKTQTTVTVCWEHVKGEKEKYRLSISPDPNEGKPHVEIPCHENRLQHTFRNLVPGKEYKVSAITIYEDAECEPCVLTIRTKVPPPENLTVIQQSITTHSFMIRWDHALGEISGYIVRYTSPNHGQDRATLPLPKEHQQATLDNLTPGTMYSVSVSSKSGEDESTSDSCSVMQSTKVLPITESDVEVQTEPTRIHLSWKHPEGCVEKYILCSSHSNELSVSPPRHTKTYDNLVPGTKYTITLETESCGLRSGSPYHKEVVTDPLPPDIDTVIFEHIGTNNVVVKWCKPEGKANRYRLSIDERDCEYVQWDDMPTYTFSSLDPGQRHKLSMVSEILDGQQNIVSEPIEKTFYTRPLPPMNVQITDISTQSFRVSWEPPSNGTFAKFRLGLSFGNNAPLYKSFQAGINTHEFIGLVSGRMYTVDICAESGDQLSETETLPIQTEMFPPTIRVPMSDIRPTSITVQYKLPNTDCDKCILQLSSGSTEDPNILKEITKQDPQRHLDHTFDDLTPGEEYRILATVHSGTKSKESRSLIVMTSLDTPKQIKVDKSFTSATISWSHAEGHKDGYTVRLSPNNGSGRKFVSKNDVLQAKFEDLVPGRKFTVMVTTTLKHQVKGEVNSDVSEETFRTDIMKPEKVLKGSIGQRHVGVSWVDVDGDRDAYCISIKHNEEEVGKKQKSAPGKRKSVLNESFTNLVPGTRYTLTIQTVSGNDKSEETPYTFWTKVAQPHIDKNLSSVDETSIHLLWKHSEGGWDGYEIEAENEETKERNPIKWACTERKEPKQLITNLVPGSWYVISVSAVRGEQRSTPVTARFRTLPNAPADVNITTTSHEVLVEWNHPDGKNDGYFVKLCSEAETDKTVSVDSLSTSYPFQHLVAGRSYTVVLWAVIKVDKRTERSNEVRRPVQTTISKPEILVLRKSETSIVLSWSDVDGDRTGYALSISPEDGDMPQRSTNRKTKEQLRTEPLYQEKFSSLCPGRVYIIRGFTESGNGKSEETVLEDQRTDVGEPKNPEVEATLTTLKLRWDPADGDVDEYHVFLEPNDDPPSPVVLPTNHNTCHQFNGLEPGRLYKMIIVTLREGVKSKECVVEEQTIVAQPRNVQVEQAGDGALRLTWEDAEGDKNGYTLEISSASEVKPETRVSCSQPKRHEWTKLVPGSLYNITIKTISHGRHSEPVTRQKRTIVARARNFARKDVEEKSIAVSWTSALGEVDKYILQISDETWVDQVSITHSEGQMSYAFGDLVPGRQYNISIKTDREGEYSDEVPLPRVRTMVSKPVNLKVEDRQTDSLRVAWTSAEGDRDAYHISIDPQEGNNPSAVLKSTDELTYTFTELTPGRLYTVSVVTDSGGDKSLAAEVKRRTLPSPPRAVEASVQGTGILVAWEPAIGDKDKYILKLFYHDKDTGKETDPIWREVEEGEPTQQIFPQLEFGRMYHVHVTTRTDDVDSEPAITSRRMTVDRPKNLSVMHKTETTAIINWDHAQGDKDKYAVKIEPNSQAGYEKEVDQEQLTYGFDNLHPGRLHGLSVCTISGDARSEPERTEFTTLARPPNTIHINKEDVKEKSLRVFWLEPESEVGHYGISISHSGREISRHEISSSSCEYLFENLTPGRLYKISVWTYVGDLGSTSAPTSVQERTLVASAKAIRVEDCTHSSISFSWDKADGDVDYYEYRVMHGKVCVNTNIMTESSDQRSVQVGVLTDRLTGGRLYELVVVAVSGERKSLPTKTNHRTKVHKPEDLHVADVKMQQVTISWRQAQGDRDKYTATVFDTTRQDRTPKSIGDVSSNASALEHRFSALVPGREYEVMLRTISGGDKSDPEKRLVRTKPLRPVNVRTSAVDTGVMVEWLEPSGDKDEYILEISPKEDLHTPVVISTGDATSYTFPGVTLGKLYDVKIFTRSKDVDSGEVIRQQRMTVGRPNRVQLQPFETSVNVTWDHAEGEKERYHITIWDVTRQTCMA